MRGYCLKARCAVVIRLFQQTAQRTAVYRRKRPFRGQTGTERQRYAARPQKAHRFVLGHSVLPAALRPILPAHAGERGDLRSRVEWCAKFLLRHLEPQAQRFAPLGNAGEHAGQAVPCRRNAAKGVGDGIRSRVEQARHITLLLAGAGVYRRERPRVERHARFRFKGNGPAPKAEALGQDRPAGGGRLHEHGGGVILPRGEAHQLEQLEPRFLADGVDGLLLEQLERRQILQQRDAGIGDIEIRPLRGVKRDLRHGLGQQLVIGLVTQVQTVEHCLFLPAFY